LGTKTLRKRTIIATKIIAFYATKFGVKFMVKLLVDESAQHVLIPQTIRTIQIVGIRGGNIAGRIGKTSKSQRWFRRVYNPVVGKLGSLAAPRIR
jgi:hypothetical protein